MNAEQLKDFVALMEKHIALYKEMRDLELEKLEAITHDQFETMDECVKREEALVLKAKGLERSREKLFQSIGIEGQKMEQIVEGLPDDSREKGRMLYEELSRLVFDVKKINENCMSLSQIRIHRVQNMMEQMQNKSKPGAGYTDKSTVSSEKKNPVISAKI